MKKSLHEQLQANKSVSFYMSKWKILLSGIICGSLSIIVGFALVQEPVFLLVLGEVIFALGTFACLYLLFQPAKKILEITAKGVYILKSRNIIYFLPWQQILVVKMSKLVNTKFVDFEVSNPEELINIQTDEKTRQVLRKDLNANHLLCMLNLLNMPESELINRLNEYLKILQKAENPNRA